MKPSVTLVGFALAIATAAACGGEARRGAPCDLDPGLDAAACAMVKGMALPDALPPARGNAYADLPKAASLGFTLFFDARLSAGETLQCADCHRPEKRFADGLAQSRGLGKVLRRSPTLLNAARMRWSFWDGRADSVWSQPLFAFEAPDEMNFTRLELAHAIADRYADAYEAIFGPLPPLSDTARFPARGRPGDSAWEAMAPEDREAVNRVAANVGKALEAYVRKIAGGKSRFDQFLAGDATALREDERRGMVAFFRAGCAGCHKGPMFTDEDFHALGVAAWPGDPEDLGREGAYGVLASSPFTGAGPYWDGPKAPPPTSGSPKDRGAFRTPSLRNCAKAGPWGHNGSLPTLRAAIDRHVDAGVTPAAVTPADRDAIVAFLGALEGTMPPLPWGDWPMR
jgi:cytochrome c peroxidase